MHCDFLSSARGIAFDDALEGLAVFLPYVLFLAAETDVLLECLCKSERSLALSGPVEKTLLLVCDEGVELIAVAVGIECKSREGNDGFTKETCLKPRESGIDLSSVSVVALEHLGIVDEKVVIVLDHVHLLECVSELSLETARVDFIDRSREYHCLARFHLEGECSRNEEVLTAVESTTVLV